MRDVGGTVRNADRMQQLVETLTEVVSAIVWNLSLPDLSLDANVLSLRRQVERVAKLGCISLCPEEGQKKRIKLCECPRMLQSHRQSSDRKESCCIAVGVESKGSVV